MSVAIEGSMDASAHKQTFDAECVLDKDAPEIEALCLLLSTVKR
jgi:hypothetical protein